MKPCFRFGQPIGTALVIVSIVETIYSLFWLFYDCSSLEYTSGFNFFDGSTEFEFIGHLQWHFWLVLHFLMSCIFWIAVIFEGKKYYLYVWLILSFIQNVIFTTNVIVQTIMRPNPDEQSFHPMLVGFGFTFFGLWRCYTMSVVCQSLRRFNNKYNLRSDSVSDIDICLEPLGTGVCQTVDFFKDLPGVGAVTLLTVELIWNAVNLCTRPLIMQMFGLCILQRPIYLLEGIIDFLMLEETAMRCGRMILDCIGIYFLSKEKLTAVRVWVVFYFFLFIVSNAVGGLMLTNWWIDTPALNIMIYHISVLVADNLFRILVLYFTIKYGMVHVRTIAKL